MPYFPLALNADNRRADQATVPVPATNVVFELHPEGAAKRSRYFARRRPGRTLETTMDNGNVRALFQQDGCANSQLYIAAGDGVFSVGDTYATARVMTIGGSDPVTLLPYREKLVARAFGVMQQWDTATATTVTDVDAPVFARALAVVALRGVAIHDATDIFGWSLAGDFTDWRSDGLAQDYDQPDKGVALYEVQGNLLSLNTKTAQFWQPQVDIESLAFSPVQGVVVPYGIVGREAGAPWGEGFQYIGHTRALVRVQGFSYALVPWRDFEVAMEAVAQDDLEDAICWNYRQGAREFWGANIGTDRAYVLDSLSGAMSHWTAYGEDVFNIHFVCAAYDKIFCASKNAASVWALSWDAHDDADEPIIAELTVHVPMGDTIIDRVVFDIETRDVPLSGQGSEPVMLVNYSTDNGQTWSDDIEVSLPAPSDRYRADATRWGQADAWAGLLIRMRISDPIGFAFSGLWINPSLQEMAL